MLPNLTKGVKYISPKQRLGTLIREPPTTRGGHRMRGALVRRMEKGADPVRGSCLNACLRLLPRARKRRLISGCLGREVREPPRAALQSSGAARRRRAPRSAPPKRSFPNATPNEVFITRDHIREGRSSCTQFWFLFLDKRLGQCPR